MLGYIRDNIFLIIAFAIGFGIAVFSVFKPWKGGLWNYPSDPVEQRRLAVSVVASFVGMLFNDAAHLHAKITTRLPAEQASGRTACAPGRKREGQQRQRLRGLQNAKNRPG